MTEEKIIAVSFTAMKKRLISYRIINEEIDCEIERLDRMHMKAESTGCSLSGMPRASSSIYDRTADTVAKMIDLESDIKSLILQRDEERTALSSLIGMLSHVGEKEVIRSRYLDLEDWNDVQVVLFGSKPDFDDKYYDYRQKMFRWHRSAIKNLAELSN